MATHPVFLPGEAHGEELAGCSPRGREDWTQLRDCARGTHIRSCSPAGSSPVITLLLPLQVHGQKAAWEDPVEWVRDTLPWPSAQQDQSKLYHLPPPTVGPHSIASPPEDRTVKDSTPSSLDSDPLVSRGRCKAEVRVSQNGSLVHTLLGPEAGVNVRPLVAALTIRTPD